MKLEDFVKSPRNHLTSLWKIGSLATFFAGE